MSRMKSLENKKTSIKSAICGLTLALAIGTIGGVGSYAYFTDIAQAKNDLVLTMGNIEIHAYTEDDEDELDFEINKGVEDPILEYKEFNIKNNGSLNQEISLSFSNFKFENFLDNSQKQGLKYTIYEVSDSKGDTIFFPTTDLLTLSNGTKKYTINNRVIKPTEEIKLKAVISGGENLPVLPWTCDNDEEYEIDFDLIVKGVQTNKGGAN